MTTSQSEARPVKPLNKQTVAHKRPDNQNGEAFKMSVFLNDTVPAGKVYHITYLKLAKSDARHKSYFKINGHAFVVQFILKFIIK